MRVQQPKTIKRLNTVFSLVFSLAGIVLIVYATNWGPGVGSDSVYYIQSADNWVKGIGFGLPWGSGRFLPYAGNPPFYPILVAALELIGMRMLPAARLICIASFGGTILTIGLLGYHTSRSIHLASGLSLIVLTSSLLVALFTQAISEPVFYAVSLSGALCFLKYMESARLRDLILASFLISAAFLTRYPGVSLALTAGLVLLFQNKFPWRTRLIHTAIYVPIVAFPMIVWMGWSYSQTGEIGERVLAPISDLPSKLVAFRLSAAEISWGWLPWLGELSVGYNTQKIVFGAGLILAAAAVAVVAFRNYQDLELRTTNRLLLRWVMFFSIFSLSFILVYLLGYALTIPTPDLIERLFSPLYVTGMFTFAGFLVLIARSWKTLNRFEALIWVVFLAVMAQNMQQTFHTIQNLHVEGLGYTGRQWSHNQMIAAMHNLPEDIPIITNEADVVLFLTGRPAVWLPDVIASQPVETFSRFGDSPADLPEERAFRERGGALVIFPSIYRQLNSLYGERAAERLSTLTEDLAVYAQNGPAEAIFFYSQDQLP